MDLFGNHVNENGDSVDKYGKIINTEKYLTINGTVQESIQRDRTYTSILGKNILESFLKNNMVMETQLVSYAFIKTLENKYKLPALKLLSLEEVSCSKLGIMATLDFIKSKIIEKHEQGLLKIDEAILTNSNEQILESAIKQLSSYHGGKILQDDSNSLFSKDLVTLYYYNNRLTQYGLEKDLKAWKI